MIYLRCKKDRNKRKEVIKMRTRRSHKKTNKAYWITGVTCTILATGVFVATARLSGDTTHSNHEPDQTQVYQAQKDQQNMTRAKLESINKEYKKKAKATTETSTEAYTETETEQYTETYSEPTTEAETSTETQAPAHNLPAITEEQIEANKKAFEDEQRPMGKGKDWKTLLDEGADSQLVLLAGMNYDTELRDLYLTVIKNNTVGYVTAQNNTSAIIWDKGVSDSSYRGIQGNETLQDFYVNTEETANAQGGTITHQGIKVTYETIWLNPGIPATGSLYKITSVTKVN